MYMQNFHKEKERVGVWTNQEYFSLCTKFELHVETVFRNYPISEIRFIAYNQCMGIEYFVINRSICLSIFILNAKLRN